MTRCIILTDAEARAAHEGRLTELRRVIGKKDRQWWAACNWEQDDDGLPMVETDLGDWIRLPAPYAVGDVLAVRETYNYIRELTAAEKEKQEKVLARLSTPEALEGMDAFVALAADLPRGSGEKRVMYAADFGEWARCLNSDLRWLSPATMPRWASRTSLLVERVGVEQADGGWVWVYGVRKEPR